ncbi:hypothetical protein CLV51_107178 [Chitinophaga niastensis]|uniref:Outer membrane protein with beta-barrel domain n=1 Tax=Chitinophaga niastensis TaxID=536980 RepID=A0A2P8HCB4_CHINA|nr:hypothetical protein [Chitinophaga niastensis]PSL43867.1 hypothetical protein CLV51_107178 [Chitinophaga niastensis]
MKNEQRLIPKKIGFIAFLIPLFASGWITICSAQNIDSGPGIKKSKPYTLRINKGDFWIGGGLGLTGSVAPFGQYIGTAATLSMKGGYHIIDKLSVGFTVTGGLSISDKKSKGIYTRGTSLLVGPIVQYMFPLSKTFFLSPLGGVNFGPLSVKAMTSAAGAPEQYIRIKGNALCEFIGIGPFFEVIPQRASFGAHFLYTFLQQTTNVYNNSGDHIPGTKITDKKNGPGMVMEFRLHF